MIPALILAGGLGTRLRSVVGDLPKPLAEVAGQPFLWWLLNHLRKEGIRSAWLSVGYRYELVQKKMGSHLGEMTLHYVVETEPLGTGGAVRQALREIPGDETLVFNGDTLAILDIADFIAHARASKADVAIALVQVNEASRYGTVMLDETGKVRGFIEKGMSGSGLINAGVYWIRTSLLEEEELKLPEKFSLEQDFLAAEFQNLRIVGIPIVSDFIDIGIPDDYARAQLKVPALVTGIIERDDVGEA